MFEVICAGNVFETKEYQHLNGAFYITDYNRDLYLWHDGSIHGGRFETEYPDDGCCPLNLDPSDLSVFNYGWWKTEEEAESFLTEWSKTHDKY